MAPGGYDRGGCGVEGKVESKLMWQQSSPGVTVVPWWCVWTEVTSGLEVCGVSDEQMVRSVNLSSVLKGLLVLCPLPKQSSLTLQFIS